MYNLPKRGWKPWRNNARWERCTWIWARGSRPTSCCSIPMGRIPIPSAPPWWWAAAPPSCAACARRTAATTFGAWNTWRTGKRASRGCPSQSRRWPWSPSAGQEPETLLSSLHSSSFDCVHPSPDAMWFCWNRVLISHNVSYGMVKLYMILTICQPINSKKVPF